MPLYVAFCPDYPNSLEKRLSVREEHLKRAGKDKETGKSVFGRAFLSEEYATKATGGAKHTDPSQPNPGMAGSLMHFKMASIDEAWARIKEDVYWTAGVWDKENTKVHELIRLPTDDE